MENETVAINGQLLVKMIFRKIRGGPPQSPLVVVFVVVKMTSVTIDKKQTGWLLS